MNDLLQVSGSSFDTRGVVAPAAVSERIDVCICTFRRQTVIDAIESVSRQRPPPGVTLRVIVADNDDTPSARGQVEEAAARLGVELSYVHAPAANISVARNACLQTSDSPWLAFIDDDETAPADWMAKLLAAREGADVVFGPVKAVYDASAPAWMRDGDYHSTVFESGRPIKSGYTGNVLIRRAALGDLRFDPALGLTGGEDTILFYDLNRRGARFVAAPEAVVFEPVPPGRARLGWLLRRRYRAGQTHAFLMTRFHPRGAAVTPFTAAAKALYSLAAAVVLAPFRERRMRCLLRAMFHWGVVVHALSGRFYIEYRHKPAA
jgi:succinoglycan biosynthesis protein ExoM